MGLIKELANVLGLLVVVLVLIGYMNNVYGTKHDVKLLNNMIIENRSDIDKDKENISIQSKILCGMAIDLSLTTAKEECSKLIRY